VNLLCLDLATTTGVARGPVGSIPESWSVRLSKPRSDVQASPRALAKLLVKLIREQRPDLICCEHTIPPMGQIHQSTIVSQEQLHGCLFGIAGLFNIRIEEPYPATVRKHVLGQGRAKLGQNIKGMVVSRMILLGYLPRGCTDHNRADACALFEYARDAYCRKPPKELVLFA
jgi:Holliday junction resolvasome RuvABC endonuclease subunit